MRRLAALLALLALCVVAAGCGGHKDRQSSPLDDAVGYFAKDAPFVAAIETDPTGGQVKQVTDLVGRFPGAEILKARLAGLLHFSSVNWASDIRPQLGAPLVVGMARPAARRNAVTPALVLALRVKHPQHVRQLLLRQPSFRGSAKSSGVRISENPRDRRYVAVDGDVVVVASDRADLAHALAIKHGDNHMRERSFIHDLAGLPSGGLVRVSADPRLLIAADPRLRPALRVNWLAALRRLGAVVKVSSSGVTLDFHAATDKASLSDSDLPLAPGDGALPLVGRSGEVQMGVHEPSRLARFAFEVWRAISPERQRAFRNREPSGIDLEEQLPHHLGKLGALAVDPINHTFALRALLNQSADVRGALVQLAPALPDLAALLGIKGVGVATPEPGESFYALARPNGKTAVFGVVGDSLVAASDASRAAGLASEPTHQAPGDPKGAAVLTLDARTVFGKLLAKRLSGPAALFAPLAVASLRDLTGPLTISRNGLDGHFKLAIVK